jgi:hypothetical protein
MEAVPFTDPAKFIQRSLTLKGGGGQGGMTTAAVTGAVLGIGKYFKTYVKCKIIW